MSIDIKKTGKNTYYRKDGNKMGDRKEKQEIMNISIKYFEKDIAVRYRASSKFLPGWSSFDKMLSGGIKRGEMAVMSACCVMPGDEYRNNMALAAMHHVDSSKVVMIGMEHEFDHTDRLAEEFKHHMDYMPYFKDIPLVTVDGISHDPMTKMKDDPKRMNMFYGGYRPGFVMIDEVSYNTMDEFDRPEFYRKDIEVVSDGCGSVYPKNPLDVLSEQFKIDVNDTHQKLVTDAINSFVNVNKPYKLVVDNEGRQLYPETSLGINGTTLINNDLNKPELDTIDIFKDKDSLNKYLNYYHCMEINVNALVRVIDDILVKDNKEVLVIDKEDDSTYFLKIDARYKSVIVDKDILEIDPESAINTEAYTTIQESLLKLLESIKGNEEFLLTYKIENDKGCEAFIVKKEWYMKKSKITLVIPDWMIEPKDVYVYMNSTGISEEEKEDTLKKRLNTLLEGTDYKWSIEEKMVPDTERTMLYNILLTRDNFVTCTLELYKKMYYTKIEALAECYYFLRNSGLKTMEEVNNMWKKNEDDIGRGSSKPYIFMDVTIEELIEDITSLLPENASYEVIHSTNEEGTITKYNIEYTLSGVSTVLLDTWCKTQAEALGNLHTYLRNNKSNNVKDI